MAFTLQQIINKKRVYLVNDFETHHKPQRLYGEAITEEVTFAEALTFGGGKELFEGTSNQNDAITFKSFAAAKEFKRKYKLTNWDINFIANPIVTQKEKRFTQSKPPVMKAQVLPAFVI